MTTININEARKLLERYYNATSTPQDVKALQDFFANADNIPDDLRVDAVIFATGKATPSADEILGADLLADIERAVKAQQSDKKRQKRLPRIFFWSTSAAAAAVMAFVVLNIDFSTNDHESVPGTERADLTAQTVNDTPQDTTIISVSEISDQLLAQSSTDESVTADTHVKPARIAKSSPIPQPATDIDDGYSVISDPEQAAIIAQRALQRVSSSTKQTQRLAASNTASQLRFAGQTISATNKAAEAYISDNLRTVRITVADAIISISNL